MQFDLIVHAFSQCDFMTLLLCRFPHCRSLDVFQSETLHFTCNLLWFNLHPSSVKVFFTCIPGQWFSVEHTFLVLPVSFKLLLFLFNIFPCQQSTKRKCILRTHLHWVFCRPNYSAFLFSHPAFGPACECLWQSITNVTNGCQSKSMTGGYLSGI